MIGTAYAAGQAAAGGEELIQLAQLHPGRAVRARPHPTHDHDKAGQRVDDDRVQEYAQRLYAALIAGMLGVGGGSGHRDGALAGLVAHQAALDALAERHTEGAAEDGLGLESAGEHSGKEPRDAGQVDQHQNDDCQHIDDRHDGHQQVGDLGDLLDAAEAHQSGDHDEHRKGDPVEGGVGGDGLAGDGLGDGAHGGDRVEALRGEAQEGVDNVQYAEGDADPRGVLQQAAAIEGQAAHILVTLLLLEQLSQGALHKGGGHAEEGGDPHPEQRAGAADVNGCRHAHDVAGPDVGGQRGHQRVERRDFALLGLIGAPGPQVFEPSKKIAECEKFQADSQIQASTDQQYKHPRSPNHVVD